MKSAAQQRPSRHTQRPVVSSIAPSTVILRFAPGVHTSGRCGEQILNVGVADQSQQVLGLSVSRLALGHVVLRLSRPGNAQPFPTTPDVQAYSIYTQGSITGLHWLTLN